LFLTGLPVTERIAHAVALERSIIAGLAPSDGGIEKLLAEVTAHLRALLRDVLCGHLVRPAHARRPPARGGGRRGGLTRAGQARPVHRGFAAHRSGSLYVPPRNDRMEVRMTTEEHEDNDTPLASDSDVKRMDADTAGQADGRPGASAGEGPGAAPHAADDAERIIIPPSDSGTTETEDEEE
jgi:hypothetical protein